MSHRRYYAIDHLRTGMMFVVMFGHSLLPYVTVPRSFKDPSTHPAFDVAAVFLYAFAMQAFFVTAGFAAALLLLRKGSGGLWRNRFSRIFLPLLVAHIILSPLMRGAYTFSKAVVEFDSIAAGWAALAAMDWLRWNKLYHLWFLLSLLVFTALAVGGLWVLRRFNVSERLECWMITRLTGYRGMFRLGLLAALTTVPSYIAASGSGTHWSMQITLLGYFVLGWFLHGAPAIVESWRHRWRRPLWAALLILPLCCYASRFRLFDEDNVDVVMGMVAGATNAAVGVAMTVALMGWFHDKLDIRSNIGESLGRASYWVYLIHFPIVVAAGGIASVLDAPAIAKYGVTLAIAIPAIGLSYYGLVLGTPMRYLIAKETVQTPAAYR